MRQLAAAVFVLLALATPAVASPGPSFGDEVSATMNRSRVDTQIGQRFRFTTTVHNNGDRTRTGLVAHLNVLSTDPGVYVDPEDWSSHRTVYLDPLPPHSSVAVGWQVQAVNDGRFVTYVAVTTRTGPATVVVSDGLRLTVSAHRTINAGGVLPVVLGVPTVLLVLTLVNLARRRRLR